MLKLVRFKYLLTVDPVEIKPHINEIPLSTKKQVRIFYHCFNEDNNDSIYSVEHLINF